jgi:prevent-host-death family protein
MKSASVGVREAKAHLSRLIGEVERGSQVIITDRGRPVARLVPVQGTGLSLRERVDRLERWGWIEPPRTGRRSLPPPLPLPEDADAAQKALQEDRDGA